MLESINGQERVATQILLQIDQDCLHTGGMTSIEELLYGIGERLNIVAGHVEARDAEHSSRYILEEVTGKESSTIGIQTWLVYVRVVRIR